MSVILTRVSKLEFCGRLKSMHALKEVVRNTWVCICSLTRPERQPRSLEQRSELEKNVSVSTNAWLHHSFLPKRAICIVPLARAFSS